MAATPNIPTLLAGLPGGGARTWASERGAVGARRRPGAVQGGAAKPGARGGLRAEFARFSAAELAIFRVL